MNSSVIYDLQMASKEAVPGFHHEIWIAFLALVMGVGALIVIRYRPARILSSVAVAVIVFGAFVECYHVSKTRELMDAYQSGNYSVAEGAVQDFHPMPYDGHERESFVVQGKRFSYSDFIVSPGFRNAVSHGGALREGMWVRVLYIREHIVRVEISSAPSRQGEL